MAGQPTISTSTFIREFEATLNALDTALTDATRAVSAIRAFVPQVSALAQVVSTIESAVSQARENIDISATQPAPTTAYQPAPAYQPTPVQEPTPAPTAVLRAVEPEPQPEPEPLPQEEPQQQVSSSGTQCIRLQVNKTSGPLDLKTVDNAMNDHPEIVDLALLDYDGHQATLKVWISGPIDRQTLEQSLTSDLLERVGDGAEVKIEFDPESAAA